MKKKLRKHNWNGTVVLLIMLSIALLSVGAASTNAEDGVLGTSKQRLRTPITYSCTDQPIDTVLMNLAEQAGIDIVKSPKVTGNVTVKVTNVPLEEALTNILAAYDYTYIATESMIRVVPIPEIVTAREQLITRIYQITYADANDVAGALSGFVSAQGEVAFNRGTKHIIVTDTESKIRAIDKFVEQIDHVTSQVLVEVRVYDITSNEGFELETQWYAARNTPLKTTEHTNTTIDTDFPTSLTETTTTVIGPSSTGYSETTNGTTTYSEDRTDTAGYSETTNGTTTYSEDRTDTAGYSETSSGTTTYSEDRTDTTTSTETTTGNYRDSDDTPAGSFTVTGDSTTVRDEDSTTTNNQTTVGQSTETREENSTTTNNQTTEGWSTGTRDENSETLSNQTVSGSTTDSGRTDTETKVTELPAGSYYNTSTERYTTRRRKPFVGGSFDRSTGGTLHFSLLNDAVDIDFMLSILHQQAEAKLLANPRILVLDNETANFEIVREIPYRELLQVAREDPMSYTEFKNVGVHLKVTPHIARDGMIRLHIEPEFGVLVGFNILQAPTIDTRRVDTTALIRDGQTIVLGGLRQKETSKDISKVPLLGDMPIVGGLFRSESEMVKSKELVVFITTSIITEPVLTETEQRQLSASQFTVPQVGETNLERKRAASQKTLSAIEKLMAPAAEPAKPVVTEPQPPQVKEEAIEEKAPIEIDVEKTKPVTEEEEATEITIILDKLLEKTSEKP